MLIKKDSLPLCADYRYSKSQDEYNYFQDQLSKTVTDQMSTVDKAYDAANNKKNQRAMDSLDKVYRCT